MFKNLVFYDNYRLTTHKRGFSDDFGSSFNLEDNNRGQQRGLDTNEVPTYQNTEQGKEENSNPSADTTPIKEEKLADNECLTTDSNKKS